MCLVNGRWAESCGFIPLNQVSDFIKVTDEFIGMNIARIMKDSLIPLVGAICTQNCVNTYTLFIAQAPVTPENIEAASILSKEITAKLLDFGISPYWIGKQHSHALFSRLSPNYVNLYRMIKDLLDPNGIMNPGMFELEKEEK